MVRLQGGVMRRGVAAEGWSSQADDACELDGRGRGAAVERAIIRQSALPQSGIHRRHQRLCTRSHQTASTTIPQSLVNQGTATPLPSPPPRFIPAFTRVGWVG